MIKKIIITILSLTFLACQIEPKKTAEQEEVSTKAPNIILLLADDLGYGDVSIYRNSTPGLPKSVSTAMTPNIDSLAMNGVRFTDFHCGAAVCSPSRAALITGKNATRLGVYNWIPPDAPMHLREKETTLAEMLKTSGYRTGHFGKWHLAKINRKDGEVEGKIGAPLNQGFDHAFFTHLNAEPSHRDPVNFVRNDTAVGPLNGYACQLVMDETLGWLDNNVGNDQPFFANIWFNEPHEKVAAPDSLARRHSINKEYYGAIENLDIAVGRLMSYLKDKDLLDNTIVIFTSDNGSMVTGSNWPLRGEKCFNYEGGVRVPFIAQWQNTLPKGKVSDAVGGFVDVAPTLLSLAQVDTGPNLIFDGADISSVLIGTDTEIARKNPLFFYRYFHEPVGMLRSGSWALLGYYNNPLPYDEDYDHVQLATLKPPAENPTWSKWNFDPDHMDYINKAVPQHFELYDMQNDPLQKNDVSAEHPDVVSSMKKEMLALRKEMLDEGGNWYQ